MERRMTFLVILPLGLLANSQMQTMEWPMIFSDRSTQDVDRGAVSDSFEQLQNEPLTVQERLKINGIKNTQYFLFSKIEYSIMRILLVKALNEKCTSSFINGILREAVSHGDYQLTKKALANGANSNIKYSSLDPLIMRAKSLDIVNLLVTNGAPMKAVMPFNDKRTVLHISCEAEYEPAVLEYYIQHAGININCEAYSCQAPLHAWADRLLGYSRSPASYLSDAQKKLALLLAAGADLAQKDITQRTALDILRNKMAGCPPDAVNVYSALVEQLTAAMKVHAAERAAKIATMIKNQSTCTICLSEFAPFDAKITLSCNHVFHTKCVESWFDTKKECPICRKPFD